MVVRFLAGFLGAMLAGLLILGGWLAYTGYHAYSARSEVSQAVASLSGMSSLDLAGSEETLSALQSNTKVLADTFNSFPWTFAQELPVIGADVTDLGLISDAAASTLASFPDDLTFKQGNPFLGLQQLDSELARAADVAGEREDGVRAVSDEGGPIRTEVVDARDKFLSAASGLAYASAAAKSLPTALGYEGPRRWMIVLQNLSETRGTGGIVGGYALATVKKGQIDVDELDTNNSLTTERISTAGIPRSTRELWGSDLSYMWGANLDRHYPFAAKLLPRTLPDGAGEVDEVLALDSHAVASLMQITGPLTVEGITVTPAEANEFFSERVYRLLPDSTSKDELTLKFMTAAFDELSSLDPVEGVLPTVLKSIGDDHFLLASQDPKIQKYLEQLPTGGVVPQQRGPWASVAVNNFSGTKLDSFLHVEANYESASFCPEPGAGSRITLTVTNNAPTTLPDYAYSRNDKGGGPKGSNLVNLAVYAPVGATLEGVQVDDDSRTWVREGSSRSHPVWQRSLNLKPKDERTITLDFEEPYEPGGVRGFSVSPMVETAAVAQEAPATCQ